LYSPQCKAYHYHLHSQVLCWASPSAHTEWEHHFTFFLLSILEPICMEEVMHQNERERHTHTPARAHTERERERSTFLGWTLLVHPISQDPYGLQMCLLEGLFLWEWECGTQGHCSH
jgi:hypothetical protein